MKLHWLRKMETSKRGDSVRMYPVHRRLLIKRINVNDHQDFSLFGDTLQSRSETVRLVAAVGGFAEAFQVDCSLLRPPFSCVRPGSTGAEAGGLETGDERLSHFALKIGQQTHSISGNGRQINLFHSFGSVKKGGASFHR
jgi:hypothetical protein